MTNKRQATAVARRVEGYRDDGGSGRKALPLQVGHDEEGSASNQEVLDVMRRRMTRTRAKKRQGAAGWRDSLAGRHRMMGSAVLVVVSALLHEVMQVARAPPDASHWGRVGSGVEIGTCMVLWVHGAANL